jgi:hypothetical protein
MKLLLNILVFNSRFPKETKERKLETVQLTSARGGGINNIGREYNLSGHPVFVCPCHQKHQSGIRLRSPVIEEQTLLCSIWAPISYE